MEAKTKTITITMSKIKETPGTVVYGCKEPGTPIKTQYVEKSFLGATAPETIKVTIEVS